MDYVKSLMKNEEWAYNQLVTDYSRKIFNICYYILHDRSDAEDTTQEVFVSIFQSIHSFRGEAQFSTWIFRLTLNKCYEKLRYKNRKKRVADTVLVEEQISLELQDLSPEELLIKKQEVAFLFEAIECLPENQRIAYTLHNMSEFTYKEIAESMNLSVSAIESLIHRAKQNLRKSLIKKISNP
jgi:RNA polymerase sigma factor (sigma-70 family)